MHAKVNLAMAARGSGFNIRLRQSLPRCAASAAGGFSILKGLPICGRANDQELENYPVALR